MVKSRWTCISNWSNHVILWVPSVSKESCWDLIVWCSNSCFCKIHNIQTFKENSTKCIACRCYVKPKQTSFLSRFVLKSQFQKFYDKPLVMKVTKLKTWQEKFEIKYFWSTLKLRMNLSYTLNSAYSPHIWFLINPKMKPQIYFLSCSKEFILKE